MTDAEKHVLEELLRRELAALENSAGIINAVESCPDETDLATQFNQRRVELALTRRSARRTAEIEKALKRLWGPEFGLCRECGEDIPTRRLAARPTAELCVRCQEAAERTLRACA